MTLSSTIVACATPPGRGGVGIIRLSGPLALTIALNLTKRKSLKKRYAQFCSFYSQDGELIDQGVTLFFQGPNSFTGEDVIELQGHGAPIVMDKLIQTAVRYGAEVARPGEFSQRAFLNDKIDLAQAEAIADLIHSHSETAAKMAVKSLQGDFSKEINHLNEKIIHLRMYVEAAIDFPEEEIDFLNDGKIEKDLENIINHLQKIKSFSRQGVIFQEGLSVVIAGRPNVGKSTLINQFAGRDVAIVTNIAGTTRDVMREHLLLDDIPVHVIDTAGIHDSDDPVEMEGIKRAWQELKKADCVLTLVDLTTDEPSELLSEEIKKALPVDVPILNVFNKIDCLKKSSRVDDNKVYISAKSGEGIKALKEKIKFLVGYHAEEGQFLARRRHLNAIDEALAYLTTGQTQLLEHKAGELLAEDLRQAHESLCEITGEFTSDELLGQIFSSFCIGK